METGTLDRIDAMADQLSEPSTLDRILHYFERFVDAHEQLAAAAYTIAHAQHRQANAIPDLVDERARWMFRMAPHALDAKPRHPDSVKDPRRRVAILALGLGEALDLWSQDDDERKRRIEVEKAERAAREAEQGSEHVGAEDVWPF